MSELSKNIVDQLKEYNDLIDEAYTRYKDQILKEQRAQAIEVARLRKQGKRLRVTVIELLSKEEFIDRVKSDDAFAKKWGIKIDITELSLDDRHKIHTNNVSELCGRPMYVIYDGPESERSQFYDGENIPTKLLTLTYDGKIANGYEFSSMF